MEDGKCTDCLRATCTKSEPMIRPTWDDYFMSIARVVAERAPCVRRQVGAALVSEDKAILATGYNCPPRGAPHRDETTCVRVGLKSGERADVVCCAHAESNAIAQAARHGVPVKGATLYVTTSPCAWCARSIINAGIVRVVAAEPYADEHAVRVFAESDVIVETIPKPSMPAREWEPGMPYPTRRAAPKPDVDPVWDEIAAKPIDAIKAEIRAEGEDPDEVARRMRARTEEMLAPTPIRWAERGSLAVGDKVTWVHHTGRETDRHHATVVGISIGGSVRSTLVNRDVSRQFHWDFTVEGEPPYLAGRFGLVKGWV